MKKNIVTVMGIILLAAALLGQCHGAPRNTTASARMSLTIKGGPLSIQASEVAFGTIDLTKGTNQAVAGNVITVADPTGTRAGWNVSAKASDLVSEDGRNTIPVERYGLFVENLDSNSIESNVDGQKPSGVGRVRLTGEEQKIMYATASKGMGISTARPSYRIEVPTDAPSGNYSGTITYTLVQGP